ncbi:flagellar assembly protein FliW [Halobacillus yeomjeoni]|uniref:Flagellar assembly factor FliW n=1 Tax=Halobacillus yeomjeoni TaxID=311194 RepID=A0A931HW41_9BACI|nr:flagellar assembly protein FliW [Halobacillus yeomjeoni]MBH0230882.1 flagellar assembly protein FliW [Halobacillus yeomjeoni]
MKIETKYFGAIEINEEQVIQFKQGLPGFKDYKEFVLLPLEEAPIYKVLQSTKEAGLAFILVNPYVFFHDYAFDIDEQSKKELELKQAEDVDLYTVMTLKDPFKQSTINLQAPIIINQQNRSAKQLILNQTDYHTKHSITSKEEAGESHAHSK